MNKSKYVLLLAASALAATAVLALPALAGSSSWLHEGEPLEEHVALSASGGEVIEFGTSVLVCGADATLTTAGGSSAQITAYNVEKASCAGVAGQLEGCLVSAATTTGLPWSVAVNTADLTAAGVRVDYSFDEACPIDKIETNFSGLTVTPEEASAISLFRFSQEGTAKVDGKETAINYVGSLQLPEEDFGTYGIG